MPGLRKTDHVLQFRLFLKGFNSMRKKIMLLVLLAFSCILTACSFEKEVDYTEITDEEKTYFTSINLDEKYVYSTLTRCV